MTDEITPQRIKAIRKRYGLSQQAFARILGIGPASIARYENGATPTKANANLIRAAEIPAFMADCLERDGEVLTAKQRANVEKIVYSEITFDEKGDIMDINEIYELTLQQEVLNEKAWDIMAQASRARREAQQRGNEALAFFYDDIEIEVANLVPQILSMESDNRTSACWLSGYLDSCQKLISAHETREALDGNRTVL